MSLIVVACGKETITEYYDSGKTKTIHEVKDGVFDGSYKEYFESGSLRGQGQYKGGRPDGTHFQYFEDGTVRLETPYRNGELNGTSRGYYESGNLHYESEFKDGLRQGWTFIFFDNLRKSIKERKLYDPEGKVVYVKTFSELGAVILNQITPYLKFAKDTLNYDEPVNVSVHIGLTVPKTIVYFGRTGEGISLLDTLAVDTVGQGKMFANFRLMINKIGRSKMGCIFSNSSPEGDSTNLRNVSLSHWIFIDNPGKSI